MNRVRRSISRRPAAQAGPPGAHAHHAPSGLEGGSGRGGSSPEVSELSRVGVWRSGVAPRPGLAALRSYGVAPGKGVAARRGSGAALGKGVVAPRGSVTELRSSSDGSEASGARICSSPDGSETSEERVRLSSDRPESSTSEMYGFAGPVLESPDASHRSGNGSPAGTRHLCDSAGEGLEGPPAWLPFANQYPRKLEVRRGG